MKKIFTGIMPAIVTPFNEDRKTVNEKATRELVEFLLGQGADGFYITGSTGEGIVMTEEERMRMCEITVSQVAGRKPIICHVAAMNFEEAVRLSKHAEKVGVDAISAIPPLFFSYTDEDIYNYYKTLAQSTGLPFVMYNHSSANGGLAASNIAKLFEVDNITGVKWTVNNYYELMKLKDMTHGEMNIINGPDEMLVSGLAAGADAGIGTTYNVMLPEFLKIYSLFKEGKEAEARDVQIKVNRVITCMLKHGVLPATKYMINHMGFEVGETTFPMHSYNDAEKTALDSDLKAAGWPFNEK